MKFLHGDQKADGITNSEVNLKNPVATQRGCKFVILDVTNLKLDGNQKREFLAVLAKYYESNFWIKLKSVGIIAWIALVLANSLKNFMSYKNLEDPIDSWKKRAEQLLDFID